MPSIGGLVWLAGGGAGAAAGPGVGALPAAGLGPVRALAAVPAGQGAATHSVNIHSNNLRPAPTLQTVSESLSTEPWPGVP